MKKSKNKAPAVTEKNQEKIFTPIPCSCTMCQTLDIQADDDPAIILTKQLGHTFLNMDEVLLEAAYAFIGRYFAEVSSTAIKLFLESFTEFDEDTLWLELVIFDGDVFFAQIKSDVKAEIFTGGGSSPLEAVMNTIAIAQIYPKQ